MFLDANGHVKLQEQLQRARESGIIEMATEHGKLMGNLGEHERAQLLAANQQVEKANQQAEAEEAAEELPYDVLLQFPERLDAIVKALGDAAEPFLSDVPIILLREVPAGTHSTAATAGAFASVHCDDMHRWSDIRIGRPPEALAALDAAFQVLSRCIYTFGAAATKTHLVDMKARVGLTVEAPCSGAAVALDASVRAQPKVLGEEQRLAHAGASDGMPVRLQMMPDMAILHIEKYNKAAARFLFEDVAKLRLADVQLQGELLAMLRVYIGF